jgi:hypothetical protein
MPTTQYRSDLERVSWRARGDAPSLRVTAGSRHAESSASRRAGSNPGTAWCGPASAGTLVAIARGQHLDQRTLCRVGLPIIRFGLPSH